VVGLQFNSVHWLNLSLRFSARAQSFGDDSKSHIFLSFIAENLPEKVVEMMPRIPTKQYKSIRQTRNTMDSVAAEVMAEKRAAMEKGLEGGKDLMSLLLRANAKEDKNGRMSDEEVNAEIM
jgi:cytochrome P450